MNKIIVIALSALFFSCKDSVEIHFTRMVDSSVKYYQAANCKFEVCKDYNAFDSLGKIADIYDDSSQADYNIMYPPSPPSPENNKCDCK